jgi:hypothetical protein
MCQKQNMPNFGGFGVGGCITCIDNSPPPLSSFKMLEEHALDDAMEVERIT